MDGRVLKNLNAMQDTAVSAPELTSARQYQIRSIPVQVSSVNRIARPLLSWSWHGEPLDQPVVAANYYLNLGAGEVPAAIKNS